MAITKNVIQNGIGRTTIKLAATAGADTATIYIRSTAGVVMAAPGNLTFTAGQDGTGTITRTLGSWITDLGTLGFIAYVTFSGTLLNNKTFSVVSLTATTLTVRETTLAEVVTAAAIPTAYRSDVGFIGQTLNVGAEVNITNVKFSLAGTCAIVRNAVTALFLNGTWMHMSNGFGLAENNTSDLVVTFNTAGGTLLIELAKINGFNRVDAYRDI